MPKTLSQNLSAVHVTKNDIPFEYLPAFFVYKDRFGKESKIYYPKRCITHKSRQEYENNTRNFIDKGGGWLGLIDKELGKDVNKNHPATIRAHRIFLAVKVALVFFVALLLKQELRRFR